MKQEASKKSKLWLWLVIGAVALLAVAGVVLALVLGSGGETDGPKGGRPELYWNIDKVTYTENSESGLSTREPGEDGTYHVRFAINGEIVEYAVADKRLINYIDSLDVMGLVKDSDGNVVDVLDPKDIAKEVTKNAYVKSATDKLITANSSVAMNGMNIKVELTELTQIYDVTTGAEIPGAIIDTAALRSMDTLSVYANDMEQVTHVYVTAHPRESKVYWRANQLYSSTDKSTTREPDENGAYTIPFFCDGERVELKTKDKAIATKIDSISRWKCHFGFTFDEEGYIIEQYASALGIQAVMVADCWDIVEVNGQDITVQRLTTNDGSIWNGTIPEDCIIYDVSYAAMSEKRQGKAVDSVQVGDRVTIWTDTNGKVILVYVSNRLVDSPAYWVPTRKYSSANKETTREIGPSGYYEVELVPEGGPKQTYYIKDKETMSYLDSITQKCVGIKADANRVVECVYHFEALTGYTCATQGGCVTNVTGSIFSKISIGKPDSTVNLVMAANARVYNVSQYGEMGAPTTIQVNDHVYGYRQPTGEIVVAFITKRAIGGDHLYWHLDKMYDSTNKVSTRVPDADGWYYLLFAHNGKQVTLKTKSLEIVESIDKLSIGATALDVSGDVITKVYDATYAYSGQKVSSGYRFRGMTEDGKYHTVYSSDENKINDFKMAEDCIIYNVSPVFSSHKGERIYSIPYNAMLTVFCNIQGEAKVVYVRNQDVDDMYWKTETLYDSTNKVTKRTPDADGYYWYTLAVNGECKTFKTKDQAVANSMDSYAGAFGLNVQGDEIKGFVSTSYVKNVKGNGVNGYCVTAINGNRISLTYNKPGSSFGKTETITLASGVKIYDVTPDSPTFGAATQLKVGDTIRTYKSREGETHSYVYILAHSTRAGGEVGYCEVCKKDVTWNPVMGSTAISAADGHWYITQDMTQWVQSSFVNTKKDYTVCLDLNGHTLTRSENGRNFRVAEGETLNIMDSVGGGKIVTGGGKGYTGGMFLMSAGGTVNMYGGTLEFVQGEIKNGNGGIAHISGKGTTFNLYNGKVIGGTVYAKNGDPGYGGNFNLVGGGTLNMYGGEISGGKVYGMLYESEKNGVITYKVAAPYGGNICMSESSMVNIMGGVIKDGEAVRETFEYTENGETKSMANMSHGGNIHKISTNKLNGRLYIENATISGGKAHRGANINVTAGTAGIIELKNATVIDGEASQFGGNIMSAGGNWTITDSKILNGKTAATGGNIYSQGGIYEVAGTTISGGEAGSNGGNIYLYKNRTDPNIFTIKEGTVVENGTAVSHGGNIYVKNKNYVELDGKVVDPKEDTAGVGIPLLPTLKVEGGKILNGVCGNGTYGGNIYCAGNMDLTGGLISGGKAGTSDYDIYVPGEHVGTVNVGSVQVDGRFRVNGPKEFYLFDAPVLGDLTFAKDVKAVVGELTAKADIKVTASTASLVFTTPFEDAQAYAEAGYFKAHDGAYQVVATANSELQLKGADLNEVYEKAKAMDFSNADAEGKVTATCPICRSSVEWLPLPANTSGKSNSDLASGHYYLSSEIDYTHNNGLYNFVDKQACIHLNGQNLTTTERAFYTEKVGTVLNIMGDGVVTGAAPGRDGKGSMRGVLDLTTDANICGGTYISTTENPAIGNRKTSSGEATVGIFAGTNIVNETAGGVALYAKANAALNICGGTINGKVVEEGSKGISVSGAPVINHIELADGVLLNVGELESDAKITVNANGVFTADLANAEDTRQYFQGFDGLTIVVEGNALACDDGRIDPNEVYEAAKAMDFTTSDPDGKVTAVCPVCGVEVEWLPLEANTGTTSIVKAAGHYYLSSEIDYTQNQGLYSFTNQDTSCINLNGQNLTSTQRAFYTEKNGTVLNIMGDGVVTGAALERDGKGSMRGVFDLTTTANFYGGTYVSTTEYPAIGNRKTSSGKATVSIYAGTTLINENANGVALYVKQNGDMNICGGTITGMILDENSKGITLSGAPVISCLDLTNGALVKVGELTEGASIAVVANGVFTSEVADIASAINYFSAEEGKKIAVEAGNLSVVEDAPMVCPHCGLTETELEASGSPWTEWNHENYGSSTKGTITSGHYYMTKDVTDMNGYYYIGSSTDDDINDLSVDVVLDMRGYSIQSATRAFYGYTNNHLTLWDSVGGSTLQGGLASSAGGTIFFGDGGGKASLSIYNVTINDGTTTAREKNGGVLFISGDSKLHLENVAITAHSAQNGAAIAMSSGESVIKNSVINGGAVTQKGAAIYMSGAGKLVIEDSTVNSGTAASAKGIYLPKSGILEVNNSTIEDVFFNGNEGAGTLSGATVIGNLDLAAGQLVNVEGLTAGASITVKADGVFTTEMADANAVKEFIHSGVADKEVIVEGAALAIGVEAAPQPPVDDEEEIAGNLVYEKAKAMDFSAGGTVTAVCPVCEVSHDWVPMPAPTSSGNDALPAGHYYLAEDMDVTKFWYIKGEAVCLNLNGKTITNASGRVFYVEKENAVLNVMGDGVVTGSGMYNSANTNYVGSALDICAEVNLYGGSWKSTNEYPVFSVRGSGAFCVMSIYEGTEIVRTEEDAQGNNLYISDNATVNMYGGIISGGTAIEHPALTVGKVGGNVVLKANANEAKNFDYNCSFNIYGGSVENGTAEVKGGCIAAVGNDIEKPSAAINICGGSVGGGTVCAIGANASVTVSGDPVIQYLDMLETNLLTVGELEDGAEIMVDALENVPFTNAIAENAQTYAAYFIATDENLGVVVNADNALIITEVCKHCGLAMDSIEWIDVANTGAKYTFTQSGHYRLIEDCTPATGNAFTFADATATTGLDVVLDTQGFDITAASGRCFYVAKHNNLTVFDSVGGSVATSNAANSGLGGSGLIAYAGAEVTIYDLTINGSSGAAGRGNAVSCYAADTVVNLYNVTLNGSAENASENTGGTVYNAGTLNMYNCTVSDSVSHNGLGSCIYSTGTLYAEHSALNGDVYVAAGTVELVGQTTIPKLQLVSGIKAKLFNLYDADITVEAEGEFTEADSNAEDYVTDGWVKAVEGKTIIVTDGVMSMSGIALVQRVLKFFNLLCTTVLG